MIFFMKNTWYLYKVQLQTLFGFNRILHDKDKKSKLKFILFTITMLFVTLSIGVTLFSYCFMLTDSIGKMKDAGLSIGYEMVISNMFLAACVVTLFTTIYKAASLLFTYRDYDIIMPLPVNTS
ncbi:MAG TPA: hypothetical protein VHP81_00815, partial [Lachnospiraceae bacterium]|nr:hypothetical protein [Lachnospiraceae bacterium]